MTKTQLRVVSKDYQAEITRLWEVMCSKDPELKYPPSPPCPSQWNIAKTQLWLNDNPISDPDDRAFVLAAVDEHADVAKRANEERNKTASGLFNKNWVGKEAILQLIHALVDNDEIKRAYLQRFNCPSDQMLIENRNTPESRAASCWAMMAEKLNDPHFSPNSILMGELHSDFGFPIVIDHDIVSDMAVATPEKVKDKWSSIIHELKRKIQNWEDSGQGDGGGSSF
jgi:hypothetical protein